MATPNPVPPPALPPPALPPPPAGVGAVPPRPAPVSMSTAQLLALSSREYMLLAGKDGAGKSCAIVSIAKWVQDALNPDAVFYVIDTENKFPTAMRSFGTNCPTNIAYFKCDSMNDVTDAIDVIMDQRRPGDWLAAESMARVWERAQDMGYMAVSGYDKINYLEKRRELKMQGKGIAAPVPSPDNFWNIVKGAHDGAFIDLISQASTLNVVLSTTISKPPKSNSFIKENDTRKEIRAEFGLDAGLDGAPRLPTYVESLVLFDLVGGRVSCRVVRDNLSRLDNPKQVFEVEDRFQWATKFWMTCR